MAAAAPASCPGQQRLEAELLAALIDYANEVGSASGGCVLGVQAALASRSCMHLSLDPLLVGYLMATFPPRLLSPATEPGEPGFSGAAGLRLSSAGVQRISLQLWDGHGRLDLHLDAPCHRAWRQWEEAVLEDYTICFRGCPPAPCSGPRTGNGDYVIHDLRRSSALHHVERTILLQSASASAGWAHGSRQLREHLAMLPAPPGIRHAILPPTPLGRSLPAQRAPRVVEPEYFQPRQFTVARAADLGEALAEQLRALLDARRIAPGDVLVDLIGIVAGIGGRGLAARWAQLAVVHVAVRHHLLRYRPRTHDDPKPGAGRPHHEFVWAVAEGN